jgi:DnaJ like chaperone protein
MVLTTKDFLVKVGLLVAAVALSSLQWSISMSPDGEVLFYLGSLLAFVVVVPIIAVIPGALFFGVAALTMDQRTRDQTRACFLMGLYVVVLLMVCYNIIRIQDIPQPLSAKGGIANFWYAAYVYAFIYSLPGVGLPLTRQWIDQQEAQSQQIAQRPGINRWLLVGGYSLLLFTLLSVLTDVGFNLVVGASGVCAFAIGLGMLVSDALHGRLRFWKIPFPSLVCGKARPKKTPDWSAMTLALIDSKNWNGLLLLTDDWLTAERGNHKCWAAKGLAHEMMGDFHKAISAYEMSLWIRDDKTVAKRLEETERKQQTQAREEPERKSKAEDGRAWEQRTRGFSSNSGYTASEGSPISSHINDYYRILEIQPGATITEVKAAYKRQMQQYHPDKVASLGKELRDLAEAKTKEINWVYQSIMDDLGT